jgi:Erythromycin biosynthesis protein CIII-like, C-terminal domain
MGTATRGDRKRILIFTIPNDGHLNIIKGLVREYRDAYQFQLVLVDRSKTSPDLSDLEASVVVPRALDYFTNTRAGRVFARVHDLLDECLAAARAFRPDLIIYDFCAVEGHFVGQVLGIRAWCSIPGLIGPLLDREYLTETVCTPANRDALAAIERKYGVSVRPEQVELISNSLHLPAELNLLWSYPAVTPSDFLTNRQPARYQFAGYLTGGHPRPRRRSGPPLLYLSFGTEVMDNLWHAGQQTRDGIRRCVAGLARRWSSPDLEVVFSTLDRFVLADYPANWQVHPKVDQQEVLSRADVFVTHGGSNSLHEAVLHQVPMVVVPFFGDQMLIGQRVEELGIGIALGTADGVDKDKPKHFLDDHLTDQIDRAVHRILADDHYRRSYSRIPLESTPPLAELG